MASYTFSDGYKIKGLDGSDTAGVLANGVNNMKNIGTKAVRKLTSGTPQRKTGANDGNAMTHDVSADNGGTTEANYRSPEQVMEELKQLHKQKMDSAFSKVKNTISSFTSGVSTKVKSLSATLKDKQEESVSTIDDINKSDNFGLVTSEDQVLNQKVEEEATVHLSDKEEKKSSLTGNIRDNLLKSLIPEGSELEGFINLTEAATANGREIPIINHSHDDSGLGK